YLKALDIAREQNARLWELRAAMNLARSYRGQGRSTEGHRLLEPVCEWFTEDDTTPELRTARLLLDELAAPPSRTDEATIERGTSRRTSQLH
ncbi:MAG: hypothetical protein LBV34_05680, partial [Nocardiopsaceae bacterium]|nr:hypothetical protein [Nocardiopsaceae bacterium]